MHRWTDRATRRETMRERPGVLAVPWAGEYAMDETVSSRTVSSAADAESSGDWGAAQVTAEADLTLTALHMSYCLNG